MIHKALAASMAMLMMTDLAAAGGGVVVKTDWAGFRNQVVQRKLDHRNVWISLGSGGEIKAQLKRIEDKSLVVKSNRATKTWSSGQGEAAVPREAISSVRFGGKVGRAGLIGGLVGLGAGAGAAAGAATSMQGGSCEGGACAVAIVLVPVGAMAGWLIGRALAQPAPVFVIQP